MDKLVELVMEKTGLSEEISYMAVSTVVDYLKEKLPESVQPMVDAALDGESSEEGGVMGMISGLID